MRKNLLYKEFSELSTTAAAQWLLGKILISRVDGLICKGKIVETEAYLHNDKACHSFGNRKTERTAPMHGPSGHAYVFLCYGIHHLLNIVTQEEGTPEAILIRAVEPLEGIELMLQRTNKPSTNIRPASGPGLVGKAFGITRLYNNLDIFGNNELSIEESFAETTISIMSGPRIGVDYAGADALLPYRYWIAGNNYVSR